MKRVALIAAGVLAAGLMNPAVAQADVYGYVDFLGQNGESVYDSAVREAAIEYGFAICDLYATSRSNRHVLGVMMRGNGNTHEAALYSFASVTFLCPQWEYLIP